MRRRTGIVPAGLLLGLLGDLLLRASGAPGLGLSVWIACVAAAAVTVHARAGGQLSGEAKLLLAVGVGFASLLAWRDAPALKVLALGSAFLTFSLPTLRRGAAWVRRGAVGEVVTAIAGTCASGALGAVPALVEADWSTLQRSEKAPWRHALAASRGVVLAVPFVLVFGSLLIAADAVFANVIASTINVELETIASHAVLTGIFAWAATGYLRGFEKGTEPQFLLPGGVQHARAGAIEAGVLLGSLNLLFLVFVIVQFRYLFGGASLIEVTPGLTYAEYARRGFFELVLVTVLVLPLLLGVDWLLRGGSVVARSVVRALSGLQIILVLAIAASALQRMAAYQTAYGLTEQRVYATALLILLCVTLLYFAATVLRGRRRQFMPGTIAASLATVLALFALNPDALIARTNLDRAATTELDGRYLAGLSGDAVPAVLSRLPQLPDAARCAVAGRWLERYDGDIPALRTWSWSQGQARRSVTALRTELSAVADECETAGT